jgi:hypothetical protein
MTKMKSDFSLRSTFSGTFSEVANFIFRGIDVEAKNVSKIRWGEWPECMDCKRNRALISDPIGCRPWNLSASSKTSQVSQAIYEKLARGE